MMTIAALGSAASGDYYQKDDYYFSRETEAEAVDARLTWFGKAAERLGLAGPASPEDFRAVLLGRNPDQAGDPLSKLERAERAGADTDLLKHKTGYDLTLSAPKSVSLAILIGGDEQLLAAHEAAVSTALIWAEKHLAITRVRNSEGEIERVSTGNLLIARTTHSTSRAGDCQIHTHNVAANATWLESKGEWRALEGQPLFENRMTIGAIYQRELASQAIELGYRTRSHTDGTFELADFPTHALKAFSKSAQRVEENLNREQPQTPQAAQIVKLIDRPKKLAVDGGGLSARWAQEAKAVGLDARAIVSQARSRDRGEQVHRDHSGEVPQFSVKVAELRGALADLFGRKFADPYDYRSSDPMAGRDPDARSAVGHAVEVLEARRAVFSRSEVMKAALSNSEHGISVSRLDQQIDELVGRGALAPADRKLQGGLTTERALSLESSIVERIECGRGRAAPALSKLEAVQWLKTFHNETQGPPLNRGQIQAAALILSSDDKFLAIQGRAGVGKTTLLKATAHGLASKGVGVIGLAPTHTAREAMAESSGLVDTRTLQSVLTRFGKLVTEDARPTLSEKTEWRDKVVIVDEASMISNADALKLLRIAEKLKVGKLVLMGDERQLGAIGPGAPFRLVQSQGIPTAVVDEIVRQRDATLRAAVSSFASGAPRRGVEQLGLSLIEMGQHAGQADLVQKAFNLWKEAYEQGAVRPIITSTQSERAAINSEIVTHLLSRGDITPTDLTLTPLSQIHPAGPERWQAKNYADGQVLVFSSAMRSHNIAKGEQFEIVGRAFEKGVNLLSLERPDGRHLSLDLNALKRRGEERFQLYEPRPTQNLRLGEAMVWERTDKPRGLFSGEPFEVTSISNGQLHLRLNSGRLLAVSLDDPQLRFIGPGYAMTTHRSQSLTMKQDPIAILQSRHASQALAYVQISRAVHGVSLITDSRDQLMRRLSTNDGLNLIAAENVPRTEKSSDVKQTQSLALEQNARPGPSNELPDASSTSRSKLEQDEPKWEKSIKNAAQLPGRGT